jgi:hypothetical protein
MLFLMDRHVPFGIAVEWDFKHFGVFIGKLLLMSGLD